MNRDLINRRNGVTLLVILVAVAIGSLGSAYSNIEISTQNASFETQSNITFSNASNPSLGLDTGEGMSFGRFFEGSNKTKSLQLNSSSLTLVESSVEGNISEHLRYDEKILFENQTTIEYMHIGSEPGRFEGRIFLDIKSAENYWGEKWLELLYYLPF